MGPRLTICLTGCVKVRSDVTLHGVESRLSEHVADDATAGAFESGDNIIDELLLIRVHTHVNCRDIPQLVVILIHCFGSGRVEPAFLRRRVGSGMRIVKDAWSHVEQCKAQIGVNSRVE